MHHVVGCSIAGRIGAFHKIDGIKRNESYVEIVNEHLKAAARKFKIVTQMDLPTKLVTKWHKDSYVCNMYVNFLISRKYKNNSCSL